jgi:hypothetical protein
MPPAIQSRLDELDGKAAKIAGWHWVSSL